MINAEAQRTKFNIVISDLSRLHSPISCLYDYFDKNGITYYSILHDKDIDNHGVLIRPHYHIVMVSNKRYRAKQVINNVASALCTNVENVQIEECDNFVAGVQYLIHKNNDSKYQYDYDDIITNTHLDLIGILTETIQVDKLSTQRLYDLIFNEGYSRKELIYSIGIGAYQHFRGTICDLFDIRDIEDSTKH